MKDVIIRGCLLVICFLVSYSYGLTRQPVNFAKGMPTKQSSWYTPKSLALEAHAVDGNTDGNYAHGSCSNTQWFDKNPWWIVHLSKTIVVVGVIIYNRVDCCGERLRNIYIEVLKKESDKHPQLCYHQISPAGRILEGYCYSEVIGSWVRIRKTKSDEMQLTLCEVVVTGRELGIRNWAEGKPAYQSSTYKSASAGKAVDKNIDGLFVHGFCSSTDANHKGPWWIVNLKFNILVTRVILYNRVGCCDYRLRYFSIEVMISQTDMYPKLCYYQGLPAGRVFDVQCYKEMIGSWVRIRKDAFNPPFDVLTLCEVIVIGTKKDKYYIF